MNDEDIQLFMGVSTTLEEIKAAGWKPFFSMGGSWWFERRQEGRGTEHWLPVWVREIERAAERRGRAEVRAATMRAMGIEAGEPGKPLRTAKGGE